MSQKDRQPEAWDELRGTPGGKWVVPILSIAMVAGVVWMSWSCATAPPQPEEPPTTWRILKDQRDWPDDRIVTVLVTSSRQHIEQGTLMGITQQARDDLPVKFARTIVSFVREINGKTYASGIIGHADWIAEVGYHE